MQIRCDAKERKSVCCAELEDNLFECYLGMYLELASVYTEELEKKGCELLKKKEKNTKHQNDEKRKR